MILKIPGDFDVQSLRGFLYQSYSLIYPFFCNRSITFSANSPPHFSPAVMDSSVMTGKVAVSFFPIGES